MKTDREKMRFTQEKLRRDIRQIAKYRYVEKRDITDFEICDDAHPEIAGMMQPKDAVWRKGRVGEIWQGYDRYLWVKFLLSIPAGTDPCSETEANLLLVDGSLHAPGYRGGFEGTIFLDGNLYQGVDQNHPEVFFGKEFSGRTVQVLIRLWSGMSYDNGPCTLIRQFSGFTFCRLDKKVDELTYDALNLLDAAEVMPETDTRALDYIDALENSMKCIEWIYAEKEDASPFYQSLYEAHRLLRQTYRKFLKGPGVTVHAFGQTHIDVAWLWRVKHAKEKSARSFATVLRYMERYPNYTFFQSQPQLYSFLKSDFPDEYAQIKQRVREGRWNADGAMWLESDCNLAGGESLVRQILYGKRFFRQEFGMDSHVLWLPDTFGFNAALPQILRKSGVTSFVTSKMCWSDYDRMPHDTFYWKGIDGSRVLVCLVTTPVVKEYQNFATTPNGMLTAKTVWGTWDHYRDKELSRDVFLCYGYGDGGGGPTREMIENKERLRLIPGLPNIKDDGLTAYCDLMQKKVEKADSIPEWSGELYLENHRGTYTSQARMKQANRRLESLLRNAEIIQTTAALESGAWNAKLLQELGDIWHTALLNQFHDILPGTAIGPVYKEAHAAYRKAFQSVWKVISCLEAALPPTSDADFSVFNPYSVPADLLVEWKTSNDSISFEANGKRLNSQKTKNGYLVECTEATPLAFTPVYFKKVKTAEAGQSVLSRDHGTYQTPFYNFRFDENGRIASLFDKRAEREILAPGSIGNLLQTYDDRPLNYDAWNIDVFYQDQAYPVCCLNSLRVVENGSLRAKIRAVWSHYDSEITQDMIVYRNTARIDFRTRVDWKERHQLSRVSFAVNIQADKATFDIPFGNIERPTHSNTSWDYAKFEVCAHKWEDLSENGYGVALMNDSKYGCEVIGSTLSLSLLKSATSPDPDADQGIHEFTYSLLPHIGSWQEADVEKEALLLNSQSILCPFPAETGSLFRTSSGIEIDAVKKCEDENCVILRLHEYLGRYSHLTVCSDYAICEWCETDLMENEIALPHKGRVLETTIQPYEIKTFKIRFRS